MAQRHGHPAAGSKLSAARERLAALNVQLARHQTGCYECSRASGVAARFCDEGWTLAKQIARAKAECRREPAGRPVAPGQGALW